MAGPNQRFADEVLKSLGFQEEAAGPPGAGNRYPITWGVVDAIKKLVGKAVIVEDSGDSRVE